jgi:CBS domain-containing protein
MFCCHSESKSEGDIASKLSKTASSVMRHWQDVETISEDKQFDSRTIDDIYERGFSRYPCVRKYAPGKLPAFDVVGVLHAKDLLSVVGTESVTVVDVLKFYERPVIYIFPDTEISEVLFQFAQHHQQIAIVREPKVPVSLSYEEGDPYYQVVGIVTVHDILSGASGSSSKWFRSKETSVPSWGLPWFVGKNPKSQQVSAKDAIELIVIDSKQSAKATNKKKSLKKRATAIVSANQLEVETKKSGAEGDADSTRLSIASPVDAGKAPPTRKATKSNKKSTKSKKKTEKTEITSTSSAKPLDVETTQAPINETAAKKPTGAAPEVRQVEVSSGHGPPGGEFHGFAAYFATPMSQILKSRLPWLAVLLVFQSLSAYIMSGFEEMLSKNIVVTFFIPILVILSYFLADK